MMWLNWFYIGFTVGMVTALLIVWIVQRLERNAPV